MEALGGLSVSSSLERYADPFPTRSCHSPSPNTRHSPNTSGRRTNRACLRRTTRLAPREKNRTHRSSRPCPIRMYVSTREVRASTCRAIGAVRCISSLVIAVPQALAAQSNASTAKLIVKMLTTRDERVELGCRVAGTTINALVVEGGNICLNRSGHCRTPCSPVGGCEREGSRLRSGRIRAETRTRKDSDGTVRRCGLMRR